MDEVGDAPLQRAGLLLRVVRGGLRLLDLLGELLDLGEQPLLLLALSLGHLLPEAFCSARRVSNREIAALRDSWAEISWSTSDSSACRARWLALYFSGFSMRSLMSITGTSLSRQAAIPPSAAPSAQSWTTWLD